MPEAGAIRAGKAYVEVGTDNNPLKRGLANAGAMLKGLGTVALGVTAGLAAAGAGVAAGLFAATKAFADSGSELADMSARTDTSVEALSALKYAAEQTGASGETLEAGLRKMLQNVQLASEGSKKATAALDRLGLTAKDFAGKSPDQMMGLIADRLADMDDGAQRTAAALAIFGKAGTQLLPMLSDGQAGLDDFANRANYLGVVMSGENADAADALGDSFDNLDSAILGIKNTIGAIFAPAIQALTEILTFGAVEARHFADESRSSFQEVNDAIVAVRDALSGGDWEAAWNVVTATFDLALARIEARIQETITNSRQMVDEFAAGLENLFPDVAVAVAKFKLTLAEADQGWNNLVPLFDGDMLDETLRKRQQELEALTKKAEGSPAERSTKNVEDKTAALQRAIEAARASRVSTPIDSDRPKPDRKVVPEKETAKLPELSKVIADVNRSSAGTFSANAVAGMGSGSVVGDMKKIQADQLKELKELRKDVKALNTDDGTVETE